MGNVSDFHSQRLFLGLSDRSDYLKAAACQLDCLFHRLRKIIQAVSDESDICLFLTHQQISILDRLHRQ